MITGMLAHMITVMTTVMITHMINVMIPDDMITAIITWVELITALTVPKTSTTSGTPKLCMMGITTRLKTQQPPSKFIRKISP